MLIELNEHTTVADIQHQFSTTFPFLKLVFFLPGQNGVPARKRKYALGDMLLNDISRMKVSGTIDIDAAVTVAALEKILANRHGLPVQVYRRSGNMWIETNITDKWTLAHQNEQGRQLSEPMNNDLLDAIEVREQESALNRDVAE
jgi:hypothetical protein